MLHRRTVRRAAIGAIALAALAPQGRALAADDAWPSRAIRLVVAQAPGGPPDLIARFIAEPLARALRVPVVIDNRPGASGIVGVDLAAHAAADGYSLLIATQSTHALVPHVMTNARYDPLRDFAPIANLFQSTKVLWVAAPLPVRDLGEFIAYARRRPGQLNYATGGVGSSNDLDARLFASAADLDLVQVPYNGPAAAIAGVASGDAQMMIVSVTTGIGPARAGRVRPLAILGDRRSPLLPDVPTADEQGLPGLDAGAWIGLVAPAGTPAEIVARVNREIDAILHSSDARTWADAQGLEITGGSPQAFERTIGADHRRWGERVRRLGLRRE